MLLRDIDSLKKYNRLAASKKKKGVLSCPDNVRWAKHIARAILSQWNAVVFEESGEDRNLDEDSVTDIVNGDSSSVE